jgi:hypothetical protein
MASAPGRSPKLWSLALLASLLIVNSIRAETATQGPAAAAAPNATARVRTLAVLPVTDTSNLNMATYLQALEVNLFQQAQYFQIQTVNFALPGFTEVDVGRAFKTVNTELMSLVYLEAERVSIFLFDSTRPKEFIVGSQPLADPMLGNQVTPQVADYKARLVFNDVLANYFKGAFQSLPGAKTDPTLSARAPDDPRQRAAESRRLFRELAALDTSKYYMGASLGMARFAGGPSSSSNVNFGAFGGMITSERTRVEFGLDFFSYALAHLDGKYTIPLAEKYVSINLSLGIGRILGVIAGPRFADEAALKNGQFAFGPGVSFNVPLLGASVRGEMKLYFGGGSIFLGSYGISYSL